MARAKSNKITVAGPKEPRGFERHLPPTSNPRRPQFQGTSTELLQLAPVFASLDKHGSLPTRPPKTVPRTGPAEHSKNDGLVFTGRGLRRGRFFLIPAMALWSVESRRESRGVLAWERTIFLSS
jgi:hypothetical protein